MNTRLTWLLVSVSAVSLLFSGAVLVSRPLSAQKVDAIPLWSSLPRQSELWSMSTHNHPGATWVPYDTPPTATWYLEFTVPKTGPRPVVTRVGGAYENTQYGVSYYNDLTRRRSDGVWAYVFFLESYGEPSLVTNGLLLLPGQYRMTVYFRNSIGEEAPVSDPEAFISEHDCYTMFLSGYWALP